MHPSHTVIFSSRRPIVHLRIWLVDRLIVYGWRNFDDERCARFCCRRPMGLRRPQDVESENGLPSHTARSLHVAAMQCVAERRRHRRGGGRRFVCVVFKGSRYVSAMPLPIRQPSSNTPLSQARRQASRAASFPRLSESVAHASESCPQVRRLNLFCRAGRPRAIRHCRKQTAVQIAASVVPHGIAI